MNILLVSLFHSQDAKKYGIDSILKPFVDDIPILEMEGIKVPFCEMPVRGTVPQITGDNLGIHSILGFMEAFSENYFCRLCLFDKVLSQEFFFSKDDPQLIL